MVWMRGAARRREAGLIGPPLRSDAGAHRTPPTAGERRAAVGRTGRGLRAWRSRAGNQAARGIAGGPRGAAVSSVSVGRTGNCGRQGGGGAAGAGAGGSAASANTTGLCRNRSQ